MAKEKGVILQKAYDHFHMPVYKKLWEILDSGSWEKVKDDHHEFLVVLRNTTWRTASLTESGGWSHAGYCGMSLSFIRWFMDSKPDRLLSQMKAAPTGVDEQAGLLLSNKEADGHSDAVYAL